jgi:hypothetical protein
MATSTEKAAKFREMAKDKSLPQEVRNTYLDRANELERAAYDASKPRDKAAAPDTAMAKGGMVKKAPVKAMAKGGAVKKAAKAPAKKMNNGGMAKKGMY